MDERGPLKRASGLPFTPQERTLEHAFSEAKLERERSFLRMCRQLGLPPGHPPKALRRLWARMAGERDEVA